MTYLAPVAPPVPVPSRDPAPMILAVAEVLQPDLAQGFQIDALRLRLEMERAFGGSDADGAWDWKLAYEAGEVALVLFLRKFGRALLARAGSPAALLPILTKVAGLLPTHTRRSEEMERFQQFSTPLPMGLAALAAAQITPRDLVLEPSAGTGLLGILAEIAGGSLALNELADTRADLLRLLFPGRSVTSFDAAQIDDHLDAGLRPSVILMNPPFSAVANVAGRTTEATARHLRSALARLAPGGRLIAITGAGFAPDAPAWAETFTRLTEAAHLVFTGAVSGAAFAKHGTSFETRLSVFDKCRCGEAGGITSDLARAPSPDIATLLSQISAGVAPRLALDPDIAAANRPTSSFPGNPVRATRSGISPSRVTPAAQPHQSSTQIEAEDLAYALRDVTEEANTARLSDAIYETFRMQAIDIPGAVPHPTKLVQSAAMASVIPPKPSYCPKLPAAVLCEGLLSEAQLETVIYAGEAHGAHLAGSWSVDETGDMVSAAKDDDPDAIRFRRGFFLGDGTGAGKGRQSAGIVLDNWAQGRRKALWISKSDKLLEDAQRDWSALGQERLLVTPLSRFAQGRGIPLAEGILFTTYATLRSVERGAKKSRVDQIVDWLGPDFDGVILFDESHAMANAAGGKGERGDTEASQQGRAGLRLQHKLPNARVVYVSATGATTVQNLAYAQRLGLWGGEDFPFATRGEFVEAIEAGGVAAMEVLARDLRSLGLYTARSLSYDGVEYETGATSVHRGSLTDYDDAHFQSRPELRRNRMSASLSQNGFLFGKLGSPASRAPFVSATPDRFPHAMMIAPTGRGKGVGFVLPNLLHFQGSAVILDVKGENFEKTSIHRQKALNNQVWYFSPYDYVQPEGKNGPVLTRTHRFNPLQRIADLPSPEQQYTAVNTMADLFLIVESVNAQSFFQAGRSLFVASCLYAIETGKPTIGEALRIMTGGGNKKEFYKRAAMQTANPVVAEIFLSMADEVDKILDSYVSVIRGAGLELWLDPAVDRATQASDFDFGTFRREPQSLYIVVQPEHLKTLAPLIRLLFADAIACLQRAHPGPDEPHPVMFLMDEFDQLGKQPLVLQSIKTIRSYGGRLFIISQSIPGLEGIYGETDRRALQAGAGVQIYMTPQDDRTADVLSAALGKRTIVGKTRSQATVRKLSESANISRRSEERALVSPAELLRFPLDKVLVLPEGQYPIKADHIRYYADRHFAEIDKARQGHALPYPPAAAPNSTRPKKITLEQPEPAAPAAIAMGDKEFETAVQAYTGMLRAYAETAKARKTRSG